MSDKGISDFEVEFGIDFTDEDQETEANEDNGQEERGLDGYMMARDRIKRAIKLPARFSDADMLYFALNIAENIEFAEPKNYKEAIGCEESKQLMMAMKEELESLEKNGT